MSQRRKEPRADRALRHLSADVLLKARTTLSSLGGALRHKHRVEPKPKPDSKDRSKPNHETLKSSRSEPQFSELEKSNHRHRAEERQRERVGPRPRPQSVGASKRCAYEWEPEDYEWYEYEYSRRSGSAERASARPLPVGTRATDSDKPRKKLSFRDPEIVGGRSATLARPQKRIGVNSVKLRPQRYSLPLDVRSSSMENLDSDLESQARLIVRTVGQAFDVCHKLNNNGEPLPSTSAAADNVLHDQRTNHLNAAKEGGEVNGGVAAATSIADYFPPPAPPRPPVPFDEIIKEEVVLPQIKSDGPHPMAQVMVTAPTMKLPDLPKCITKVEVVHEKPIKDAPLAAQHQVWLLQQRLELLGHQTRAALAQLILMRNQLTAEQSARCEAQARTHVLLNQNKELLDHIASLVDHLKERECGNIPSTISPQHLTLIPQLSAKAKIDRWFSKLPSTPAMSRPESGFVSAVDDDDNDAVTLAEAKALLLHLATKKKKRFFSLRLNTRKTIANKHTQL